MSLNTEFEALLHELENARVVDEELHRGSASLAERVESHERLVGLRAELARCRVLLGVDVVGVSGAHDSRTRRSAT